MYGKCYIQTISIKELICLEISSTKYHIILFSYIPFILSYYWYDSCFFTNDIYNDNAATKSKSNISKNEWEAIKSLKENDSIVIKEADKGGALVVMNKIHYYSIVVKIL